MSGDLPGWMLGAGLDTDMTGDTPAFSTRRFWMKKGSERSIVFLTEGNAAPVIWEHNVKLGTGKTAWLHWFSCLRMLDQPCPLCEWSELNDNQHKRYKGVFFTVIDCNEWTDAGGRKHVNERRLLCAKKEMSEVLKRMYLKRLEADQGMRGAQFDVYRTNSDTSSSIGDQYNFVQMVDLAAYPETEEFDYSEILSPDKEKAERAVAQLEKERGGGGIGKSEEGTDSKVPFE